MKKIKINQNDVDVEYLKFCLKMTPVERLEKGFELSNRAKLMNKHIALVIDKRLSNNFLLR